MQEAEATIGRFRNPGHLPFKTVSVYMLKDPRDGSVRYVGVTTRSLAHRLAGHIGAARTRRDRTYVRRWVKSLLDDGVRPEIPLLETVPAGGDWQAAERRWILHYRTVGAQLTNLTDGGDGTSGWVPTPEYREALRIKSTGRRHTPETLAKMSVIAKVRGIPESTREKGRAALRRETRTPEMVAKLKATFVPGMLGKRHSAATKAKMSATQKSLDPSIHPRGAAHSQARPVIVDGRRFSSFSEAAQHLGVTQPAISVRVKQGSATYADDTGCETTDVAARAANEKAAAAKHARRLKMHRPVCVDGIRFESLKAAAAHCGICPASMIGRIQSGRHRAHYAND